MKKIILSLSVVSILFLSESCDNPGTEIKDPQHQGELLSNLFSTVHLKQQRFQINPHRDTLLQGSNGTVLRIYKNTFVDGNGNAVVSAIEIELKEALDPIDIASSNLTTTSEGKPLQTGGMIYLDAKCDDQSLRIAPGNSIGVIIPQDQVEKDMKIFKGEKTDDGINWIDPSPILNGEVQQLEQAKRKPKKAAAQKAAKFNELDAIFDFADSDTNGMHQAAIENQALKNAAAADIPKFGSFTRELAEKGQNYFSVDYNTSYLFELKHLGWANIDRLYSDPRTQLVDLTTQITNSREFDEIYIIMVISDMYLPGYQMKNGNFSFTHGDEEKPELPVGEKAIIYATAYKDDSPYFDIITTSIKHAQTVKLNLKETTEKKLKAILESKL